MINDYIRATMTVEEMVESYRCWERGEEWVPSRERLREAGLDINLSDREDGMPLVWQVPPEPPALPRATEARAQYA
jgi:hypothetical protein